MSRGMKITLGLVVAGIVVLAISQARAQQPASDPASSLAADWNAYQNAQRHVLTGIQAVTDELVKARAENAALVKERDGLKVQLEKLKPAAAIQSDGKPMPPALPLDAKP